MLSIAEGNVRHPSVADAKQACEKNSSSKGDSAHSMRFLADGFEPGEHDVLCGRGRKCFNHPGNVKFREIVLGYLGQYSKAMTKLEKSYILSDVVENVRKNSGMGGFVKKNEDGRWYEVGDFLAREKTSQAFRDVLHDKYKSSNTSKKKRRQEEQADKLFRTHSNRSLDCASVHSSSTQSEFSKGEKLMRLDRPDLIGFAVEEPSPDELLGALDKELANSFGGRKGLASQRSQRSVMEFDKRQTMLQQAKSGPSWYNHSCPNLLHNNRQRQPPPQAQAPLSSSVMDPHMDHMDLLDHPPVSQVVFEDSVMEPTPFESHMDTIDGSRGGGGGGGMDFNMGAPAPTQYRNEWLHHSQPNLFANIHNPQVASRRRQFARMPPRRQGSARDVLSRQGSGRNLMRQGSGRNLMNRQGSGRNLMRQGSGRSLMAGQASAPTNLISIPSGAPLVMSNSSHQGHAPMNNGSSASSHSRHSMGVFEDQMDTLALSDRAVPQPPPPTLEEPEDIDVNELVLSPMAGETKESLLASLASLSDSFAIEPIEENPFEPVPLSRR